ncbi:hypothetical protein Tco_0040434 [Tanacetum coccineum]
MGGCLLLVDTLGGGTGNGGGNGTEGCVGEFVLDEEVVGVMLSVVVWKGNVGNFVGSGVLDIGGRMRGSQIKESKLTSFEFGVAIVLGSTPAPSDASIILSPFV